MFKNSSHIPVWLREPLEKNSRIIYNNKKKSRGINYFNVNKNIKNIFLNKILPNK